MDGDHPVESKYDFIQIFDLGNKVVLNNINGYFQAKIVPFLVNLHLHDRPIFISRHGQSQYNLEDRIGGDSGITDRGEKYAVALAKFFAKMVKEDDNLKKTKLFCTTLHRT
jgi:hypothetical protein